MPTSQQGTAAFPSGGRRSLWESWGVETPRMRVVSLRGFSLQLQPAATPMAARDCRNRDGAKRVLLSAPRGNSFKQGVIRKDGAPNPAPAILIGGGVRFLIPAASS